jgi:hypothetical protein
MLTLIIQSLFQNELLNEEKILSIRFIYMNIP